MKQYTYKLLDGTSVSVEVTDEQYEAITAADDCIRKSDYNYERHNISLSKFKYEGEMFIDPDADPQQILEKRESALEIQKRLEYLSKTDQLIAEWYFYDKITQSEIAKRLGVKKAAICRRLGRIKEKLKIYLSQM